MSDINLVGSAAVFGVNGLLAWTGVLTSMTTAQNVVTGGQFKDQADKAELKNGKNRVIGKAASNRRFSHAAKLIPVDANGNLATAKTNVKVPDPLGVITISGYGLGEFDGNWNYDCDAEINLTPEGYIEYSMTLTRHGDNPKTATAFTPTT